jgi:hypothetical protein
LAAARCAGRPSRRHLRDRRALRGQALRVSASPWFVRDKWNHETLRTFLAAGTILVLALLIGSCNSRDPIRATAIQLGRSLNPDHTVGSHTTRFKTNDTIYAAVLTTGSGSATVSARWTYAGRVVGEPRKEVRYKGEAATEFHLQNSSGFPPGDYTVELFVNDKPVGSRAFRVEK